MGHEVTVLLALLLAASLPAYSVQAPLLLAAAEQDAQLLEQGQALLQQKKFAEARTMFNRALEVNPKNAVAAKGVGDTYRYEKNWGLAMVYYGTAEKLDPHYVAAFEGSVLAYQLKPDQAAGMRIYYLQRAARAGSATCQKVLSDAHLTWEEKDQDVAAGPKAPALIEAAFKGDLAQVKSLLAAGAKVNEKMSDGGTALSQAAFKGHAEVVALLLEKGAELEAPMGDEGYTPLMTASMMGQAKVVEVLVNKGANLDAISKKGDTSLGFAVLWGASAGDRKKDYVEVVRLLVNKGADVNLKSEKGISALRSAELHKNQEMVDIMQKAGAK